jgi:hypothetical protein
MPNKITKSQSNLDLVIFENGKVSPTLNVGKDKESLLATQFQNLLLNKDIKSIVKSINYQVPWQEIVEFEKMDERVAIANCIFANLIGVNEGYIECCPSDNTPSLMETFTWWWVVRPDLGAAIAINLPDTKEAQKLREAIADYILGLQWRGYF